MEQCLVDEIQEADEDKAILISQKCTINTPERLQFVLEHIFNDTAYIKHVHHQLINADPEFKNIDDLEKLISVLRHSFRDSINWDAHVKERDAENFYRLSVFQEQCARSMYTYTENGKPRKDSVFWPNPNHEKYPASRFDTLPYVQRHGLIDKSTPIGSAGSCFANEVAKVLQEEDYNYVVTERADDLNQGVIVDGYTPGSKIAPGSFSSGIQFNTGNMRHLAEKAFHEREFKKVLLEVKTRDKHLYMDPYREDVFFRSEQDYINNYEKHREAIRKALTTCEVFILTPGLNECWQLKDGTYMARNPREAMYFFAKSKVLSVADNVENLEVFNDLVLRHNPNYKLILTVSPVPFLATTRADTHHVIEANCHSKATLRVAVEEVVKNNSNVYYLPSYEYVSQCVQEPWLPDDRHVKPEVVSQIMGMFKQMFFK